MTHNVHGSGLRKVGMGCQEEIEVSGWSKFLNQEEHFWESPWPRPGHRNGSLACNYSIWSADLKLGLLSGRGFTSH